MISVLLGWALQACTSLYDLCCARPHPQVLPRLRYTHSRSLFLHAMSSRPTHTCTMSTPQACALKACQPRDPQTHKLQSAGPLYPPGLSSWGFTDTQDLHSAGPRPSGTPGPCSKGPLFHLSSRPMGPHSPATHHRRAPNLPKRHTQTSLDAKGLTSEQLILQFYCSRTADFFAFFFPFL
jgi:hypothetical protein